MKRLVADHGIALGIVRSAIQPTANLTSHIEQAAKKAVEFQGAVLQELLDQGGDSNAIVRIRVTIETMPFSQFQDEYGK